MDPSTPIEWLSAAEIETPLRNMTGTDTRISGEWSAQQFKIGQGDGLGTWRIAGSMSVDGATKHWSMVLKGWLCGDRSGTPSSFNWPWREAELYSSGLLNDLPGVAAPACFHSVEREDTVWVWLEDLTTIPQERWTLEHYASAGRLLGQFNGAYLSETQLPEHPSLSQNWLAGWSAEGAGGLRLLDQYRNHPHVQQIIPADVEGALRHTWSQRQGLLHRLTTMPQTFCHLDAFHANTFFRDTGPAKEMVLIDWSFAGIAAAGEELAALCMAGFIFDPATSDSLGEIERVSFDAYMSGLEDAGWNGDAQPIWDTYRSTAILRYGLSPLARMLAIMTNDLARVGFSGALGVTVEQAEIHLARHYRWIADHACEM